MTEERKEFFDDFIDDYYAECEEHLISVRRNMLGLEGSSGNPQERGEITDSLFRSFHTLKGLSGMVSLREAEELAHATESYLRTLRKGEVTLSAEAMDALMEATGTLEKIITAHRNNTPKPPISSLLERLSRLVPRDGAPSSDSTYPKASEGLNDEELRKVEEAPASGTRVFRFLFAPDRDLAQRGINVNSVRTRLQEIGALIRAKPLIGKSGEIQFEFLVSTRQDDEALTALAMDGLSYTPFELPQNVPPATGAGGVTAGPAQATSTTGEKTQGMQAPRAASTSVRVELSRVDELMRMVGDLVVSRARMDETLRSLEPSVATHDFRLLQDSSVTIGRQLREMREAVMRIRMIPIGEVFDRMRFHVRDLAREFRKEVATELHGAETELDKYLVERLMDPLLHMVRNSISHGIEPPDERRGRGKPPAGRLILKAAAAGESVVIEVEDDGRGMEAGTIAERARSVGVDTGEAELDPASILGIISEAGFTTLDTPDLTSGRGVGMTIVRNAVRDLGGSIELDTRPGYGTRFVLTLPLTLAITDALLVSVGSQTYAVPTASVLEIVEVDPSSITVLENNEMLRYREGVLTLLRLSRLFGIKGNDGQTLYALVVRGASNPVGLAVDRLLGQREIVVHALQDPLLHRPGLSGATEMGNGRIVLILDVQSLLTAARGRQPQEESL